MKLSILTIAAAAFLSFGAVAPAAAVLNLDPLSGAISGPAGSSVGWGFTLTNPTDFAVVTSSNFCLGTSGITSLCISPVLGTYSDQIATNYTIAGQNPENPVVTGQLGTFLIDAGAPVGSADVGQLVLTYDLYSVDPLAGNFDPTTDLISAGNFLSDSASVSVISGASVAPEPSSLPLIALAGIAWILWRISLASRGTTRNRA